MNTLTPADILVVDDAPANLQLLTGILKHQGFNIRPVPSGELALQAARHVPPDLILLDITMPGMNGYEVCAHLKADAQLKEIPVIFISALNEVMDKVKAFQMGGVDYVAKPFQAEEVEARVRTHLELARLRCELRRHNANLEAVVAQRTRELASANARLGILDQAKSDFLRLIAHEIRTPLCGILGVVEMLLLDIPPDLPSTSQYQNLYSHSRHRLMTLIDDALMFAAIESSPQATTKERHPLADLLERARSNAAELAGTRKVQIAAVPAELGVVAGESEHLVRALQSLLETAIKFSSPNTTVQILKQERTDEIGLTIETTGRSIPADALPRFFDLLAIAEPITPGGDLGIAPALAERILTLYGGSLHVENRAESGIRLLVTLKSNLP